MSRKYRLAPMFAAALFGSLVGLLPAAAQTKIAIGTAKDPNLAAQVIIARDKGFFKEAGLDATISDFPSGGDLMAAFVGGSVQIATAGATPVITLGARPFSIAIVAQVSDISGAQQLLVHEGVNSLEQLYGKKIGVLKGTASEALFNSIVKGYHLDASKFEIVNLGPTEMLQAFVRSQVDAVALWEPHSTRAREAGKGKTLVSGTTSFIPGKEGPRRVYGDHAVLFTSQDFARKDGDTVKKVITALDRANAYLKSNRKEAVEILAKAIPTDAGADGSYRRRQRLHAPDRRPDSLGHEQAVVLSRRARQDSGGGRRALVDEHGGPEVRRAQHGDAEVTAAIRP